MDEGREDRAVDQDRSTAHRSTKVSRQSVTKQSVHMSEYEYVYAVKPDRADFVKVGCHSGSILGLQARYRTPYGRFDIKVFQCTKRRQVEKDVQAALSEFHYTNELYEVTAWEPFMVWCHVNCMHHVVSKDLTLAMGVAEKKAALSALIARTKAEIKTMRRGRKTAAVGVKNKPEPRDERTARLLLEKVSAAVSVADERNLKERERLAGIAEFVGSKLERCEDGHAFMTRAEVYQLYKQSSPEGGKHKIHFGKGEFFEELKKHMGPVKSRHGRSAKDVFLGWRIVVQLTDSK